MKTRIIILSGILSFCLIVFSGCDKKEQAPETEPEIKNPEIELSSSQIDVKAEGGEYSISYKLSNPLEGEHVKALCSVDWISEFNYDQQDMISFTVSSNSEKDNREAEIQIDYPGLQSKVSFSVLQSATPILTVGPEKNIAAPAAGAKITLTVAHNIDYKIVIDDEWIKQNDADRKYAEDVVSFSILANETSDSREGSILFISSDEKLSQEINIMQEGAVKNVLDNPDEYFLPMIEALGKVYEESGVAEYEESLGHTPKDTFPGFWTFETGKELFFMTGYLNGWEGTFYLLFLKSVF